MCDAKDGDGTSRASSIPSVSLVLTWKGQKSCLLSPLASAARTLFPLSLCFSLGLLAGRGALAQTPAPLVPPPPTGTYSAGAGLQLSNANVFSIAPLGVTASMLAKGAVSAGKIALPLAFSAASGSPLISAMNTGSGYGVSGSIPNEKGVLGGVVTFNAPIVGTITDKVGVYGNDSSSAGTLTNGSAAIVGVSSNSTGILGVSNDAVQDPNTAGVGVVGVGYNGNGINGFSVNNSAIYGESSSNYSGEFNGDVEVYSDKGEQGNLTVQGTLSAGAKHFKIDHPQDPTGKYLVHASVESDQMMDIYDGVVTLDRTGAATVTMPSWFEALNQDFRYQLTCIGGYAPVYISQEVTAGRFAIAGGKPGLRVSWQVTGARHDAFARAHPLVVEEEKPERAQGTYLDPADFGQPASKGETYGHHLLPTLAQPANP